MTPALLVLLIGVLAPHYRRVRWSARSRPIAPAPAPPTPPSVRSRGRRRADAIESVMPDAIELVVMAVRGGALPAAAIGAVTPHVHPVLAPAFHAVHRGVLDGRHFADAVQQLPAALGPRAVALADSLAAADRDGLPLAPVLDRLAAEARQQRRRHADMLARQLPVRLSLPLVLCTLPSFVLLSVVPLLLAALSSLHR